MGPSTDCPHCEREVKRTVCYGTGAGVTLNVNDTEIVCICPAYDRAVIH